MTTILIITYIILAIIWAFYAAHKTSTFGKLGKLLSNQIQSFLINLIFFPYCVFYAIKHKEIKKNMIKEHEIIVYDENNNELERTMASINATHMIRIEHIIGDYTTYSFNTHYNDGTILFGMIPEKPFSEAHL